MIEFTCLRKDLVDAVSTASRAVSVSGVIPALEGVLIRAADALTVTGYNLETGITVTMGADIRQQGSAIFPARLFGDIVKKLPEETVTVTVDEANGYLTRINSGKSNFSIPAMDPKGYPQLPEVGDSGDLVIEQSNLKDLITSTVFAVSSNTARMVQTGCKFEVDGDAITMVACDGYRLAVRRDRDATNTMHDAIGFVVPATTLREVSRSLTDSDADASITLAQRHVLFRIENTVIVSRLLEGEFLDWKSVLPKDNPIQLEINTKEFKSAIERVSLIVTEKQKSLVRLVIGDEIIELRTENSIGNAYDECSVIGNGNDMEIGFNCRYLLDVLKAISDDTVQVSMKDPVSSAVIEPIDSADFTYMVLPVRLRTH